MAEPCDPTSGAIPEIDRSIEASSRSGTANHFFFLALCYESLGDHSRALEYYRKARRWVDDDRRIPTASRLELEHIAAEARQVILPPSPGAPTSSEGER